MSDIEQRYKEIEQRIKDRGFKIIDHDLNRPWGGFFVIDEEQAEKFVETYFTDIELEEINISGLLSPKILVIEPDKRHSWQYHHRRAEIWQIVEGPVGVIRSVTDQQKPMVNYEVGDQIRLKRGERHRLVGLKNRGVVAEIWQHVYADHPSNEKDIVRLEDDFGR